MLYVTHLHKTPNCVSRFIFVHPPQLFSSCEKGVSKSRAICNSHSSPAVGDDTFTQRNTTNVAPLAPHYVANLSGIYEPICKNACIYTPGRGKPKRARQLKCSREDFVSEQINVSIIVLCGKSWW